MEHVSLIRHLRRTRTAARFRRTRFYLYLWLRQYNLGTYLAWILVAFMACLMYTHVQNLYRIQSIRASALDVRSALIDIETEQRGFLLSGATGSAYLDGYRTSRTYLAIRLTTLCRKIPRTDENMRLCQQLEWLTEQKLTEMESTIRMAESGNLQRSVAIFSTDRGERLKREILTTLDRIRFEQVTGGLAARMASCLIPN